MCRNDWQIGPNLPILPLNREGTELSGGNYHRLSGIFRYNFREPLIGRSAQGISEKSKGDLENESEFGGGV